MKTSISALSADIRFLFPSTIVWDCAEPSLTLYTSAGGTEECWDSGSEGRKSKSVDPPSTGIDCLRQGVFALTNMSAFGHESLSFLLHSRILSNAFIELLFLCCFHTRGPFWWPWSLSHSSCGPPHSFFKFLGLSSVHLLHAWQRLRWWSIWNKS